ncbi:MAG: sigma-54-dependent Fis family transcriptional regulator [Acidobacteriota bacterium]
MTSRNSGATEALLQEALALALRGRRAEALALLDDLGSAPGVTLARARVLASSDDATDREQADELLSERLDDSWRFRLEASRQARGRGDLRQAVALLEGALRSFRESTDDGDDDRETLAELIRAEVRALEHRDTDPSPTDPARAPLPESISDLVALGRELLREDDPEQVLRAVLQEAVRQSGARRGYLVRAGDDGNAAAAFSGLEREELDSPELALSRSLVREAESSRRPIFIQVQDLPDEHPARASLAAGLSVHAVTCLPLVEDSTVLGVLYLEHPTEGRGKSDDRRRLLELLVGLAAGALANADARRAERHELESARETIRRQREKLRRRERQGGLVGDSPAMQEVYDRLDLYGQSELPALILGETGTGKELAARFLHENGPRRDAEMVAINCAGMAETLLEGELFGHERGAFTGADQARAGLFEVAHRGTLFLDEVGDMSPRMQGELLRVLQSGELRRVGGRTAIRVDVRLIAATHRDLEDMVAVGDFRQDLYYRLNVLQLRLPPLRERLQDLPLLATELLERVVQPAPRLSDRALQRFQSHHWPGNVRELENLLQRLCITKADPIDAEHLPAELGTTTRRRGTPGTLQAVERQAILDTLDEVEGNKTEAARRLGISRRALYSKLERWGLS